MIEMEDRFVQLNKLKPGDKVAVLSPSFAAPGRWPHVYELGLKRLKDEFGLEPVEFPTTKKLGASGEEKAQNLIAAFESKEIKGVIATLGGNDQVTYVKKLPREPFVNNPKPFFGFSDNTHFENFLWLNGIPSFYGACLFTQFAEQGEMNEYTVRYLRHALFDTGEFELEPSKEYNDVGLNWNDPETLNQRRVYEPNEGWYWDGGKNSSGITWGGCVESVDEMLRHGVPIPSLTDFENIVLFMETSEELPSPEYVFRVYRALGERGILERIQAVLVGRAKAWEFDKPNTPEQKAAYKKSLREMTLEVVRKYNPHAPIVQNMDFGHTDPQIPLPNGRLVRVNGEEQKIFVNF